MQFFSNRSVLAHDLVRRFFQATNLNHLFLQWPLPSFLTRLHTRVAAKGTFLWLHLRKESEETRPTGHFFVTRLSVKIVNWPAYERIFFKFECFNSGKLHSPFSRMNETWNETSWMKRNAFKCVSLSLFFCHGCFFFLQTSLLHPSP
jgi:hypothetical protein